MGFPVFMASREIVVKRVFQEIEVFLESVSTSQVGSYHGNSTIIFNVFMRKKLMSLITVYEYYRPSRS